MRLLVFGGSFNPVHWGHLLMAEEVREEFGFDRVLFVPAARSPFKDGSEDPGPLHRLAMLRLACADNPLFDIDDRELRRGGSSFTIDTLKELVAAGGIEARPGLLVGEDMVEGLPRWRSYEELQQVARIIVGRRGGEAPPPHPHQLANNRPLALSSSEIRARVAAGRSLRYLLPPSLIAYIAEEGLYAGA